MKHKMVTEADVDVMKHKMVTEADVLARVAEIAFAQEDGDYEKAHSFEDALYVAVLQAISANPRGARALAKAALQSQKLDFERHCA